MFSELTNVCDNFLGGLNLGFVKKNKIKNSPHDVYVSVTNENKVNGKYKSVESVNRVMNLKAYSIIQLGKKEYVFLRDKQNHILEIKNYLINSKNKYDKNSKKIYNEKLKCKDLFVSDLARFNIFYNEKKISGLGEKPRWTESQDAFRERLCTSARDKILEKHSKIGFLNISSLINQEIFAHAREIYTKENQKLYLKEGTLHPELFDHRIDVYERDGDTVVKITAIYKVTMERITNNENQQVDVIYDTLGYCGTRTKIQLSNRDVNTNWGEVAEHLHKRGIEDPKSVYPKIAESLSGKNYTTTIYRTPKGAADQLVKMAAWKVCKPKEYYCVGHDDASTLSKRELNPGNVNSESEVKKSDNITIIENKVARKKAQVKSFKRALVQDGASKEKIYKMEGRRINVYYENKLWKEFIWGPKAKVKNGESDLAWEERTLGAAQEKISKKFGPYAYKNIRSFIHQDFFSENYQVIKDEMVDTQNKHLEFIQADMEDLKILPPPMYPKKIDREIVIKDDGEFVVFEIKARYQITSLDDDHDIGYVHGYNSATTIVRISKNDLEEDWRAKALELKEKKSKRFYSLLVPTLEIENYVSKMRNSLEEADKEVATLIKTKVVKRA